MFTNNIYFNIYSVLIELYFLIGGSLLLLFSVLFSVSKEKGYTLINNITKFLTFQIIVLGLLLLCKQSLIFFIAWNDFLIFNLFNLILMFVILITSVLWFLISFNLSEKEKILNFEFWILILFSITTMLLLTKVYDLLSTYVTLECQSLIFYILASFNKKSEFSSESGIKYFILGAFSSSFLLFAFAFLYGVTGLTNFQDLSIFVTLSSSFYEKQIITILLLFILFSFFFKLSAAPFHMWSPDVYEGSPHLITSFFLILPKTIILSLILKFLLFIFPLFSHYWSFFLFFVIFMSTFIGTFTAFMQIKWKRFIAFSSITHVSFLILPIVFYSTESLSSLFCYLIIYILMTLSFFSVFTNLYILKYPFFSLSRFLHNLFQINYLNPSLSFSITVILFSMAGIPPLAGFFTKFLVLACVLKSKIFGLLIFVLICTSISSFYYLRFIRLMYFHLEEIKFQFSIFLPFNKINSIILSCLILVLIFLFIDFEILLLCSKFMTLSLYS